MTGAIRGVRLAPEVKLVLIGAIAAAKQAGFAITRSCELLILDPKRFHRWIKGRDLDHIGAEDLADRPPVPKVVPNKITEGERRAIIEAARDPDNSHLRHRKLTHHLSRSGKAFISESTTLRVLRSVKLVCAFVEVRRPKGQRPETITTVPNQIWGWDISWVKVAGAFWYLIAIIDLYSRKIVGHAVRPQATAEDVKDVFDKPLAFRSRAAAEVEVDPEVLL